MLVARCVGPSYALLVYIWGFNCHRLERRRWRSLLQVPAPRRRAILHLADHPASLRVPRRRPAQQGRAAGEAASAVSGCCDTITSCMHGPELKPTSQPPQAPTSDDAVRTAFDVLRRVEALPADAALTSWCGAIESGAVEGAADRDESARKRRKR